MSDFFEQWAKQSDENSKLLAQELLITEVTESIWKAMEEVGLTKTELASKMNTTKGYVSQVLSGSRNMTLRTLADICFALGDKPVFSMTVASEQSPWKQGTETIDLAPRGLQYTRTGNVMAPVNHWERAA